MKLATVFQIITLVSAAPAAADHSTSFLRAGGKADGNPRTTLLVEIERDEEHGTATLAARCDDVAEAVHGDVVAVYDRVLNGCAIAIPATTAFVAQATMAADPHVTMVEEDQKAYASSYAWGLDRVDQCALFPKNEDGWPVGRTRVNAAGVEVYIVDTGIRNTHEEFSGIMSSSACHKDYTDTGSVGDPFDDGHGHGYVTLWLS